VFPVDPSFEVAQVIPVDLDHDGRDELVVMYAHQPFWPSYSVLVDPRTSESSVVLMASGHHRLIGTADLDGDGVDELIFCGPNNRMGWQVGIAAVRVRRNGAGNPANPWASASSADADYSVTSSEALVWYCLLPRRASYVSRLAAVDTKRRSLTIGFGDGGSAEVTFDGFTVGSHAALSGAARNAARADAYRNLREAIRKGDSGDHVKAVELVAQARVDAERAGDETLERWVATSEAKIVVRAGRFEEGAKRFEALLGGAGATSEVCLEAAKAFEAAGQIRMSADWYRRGLTMADRTQEGWPSYMHIEGLVLALAEIEAWPTAGDDLEHYARSNPADRTTIDVLRSFIDWRSGVRPVTAAPRADSVSDLRNYWSFEFDWANGVKAPEAFLRELDAWIAKRPDPAYLFDSLRAEVLWRLGRHEEALAAGKRAFDETLKACADDSIARAHLALVAERYQSLAASNRDGSEVARVKATLRSLRKVDSK
jgi:tetratricopeptide (TPR) repeat protein